MPGIFTVIASIILFYIGLVNIRGFEGAVYGILAFNLSSISCYSKKINIWYELAINLFPSICFVQESCGIVEYGMQLNQFYQSIGWKG